jgi:hypothetical protein
MKIKVLKSATSSIKRAPGCPMMIDMAEPPKK